MKSRLPVLAAILAGACSAIRPVKLTPPPAPKAFFSGEEVGLVDKTTEMPGGKAGAAAKVTDKPVWWSAFADPALDGVIQEALRNNYFIRDVRTLIYENGLDPNVPWNWLWPLQVGIPATAPAVIQSIALGAGPSPKEGGGKTDPIQLDYNAANIGLSASYQVDLWGNLDARRRVGHNLAEQQRQSTELASQNLAEQITQLWFDILVNRALKELTEGEVKYNQELFDLVKARFDSHLSSRLVVLQQEQQLLNIQSQVPLIAARISTLNSQLTLLLGRTPNGADALVPAERKLPDLPPPPDLGKPEDLNTNTAEMRFARLRVTEIEHRVNQNLSSWLPVIELIGSAGIVSYEFSDPIRESVLGVRLTWPVFDGGRRILESKQLDLTLKRRKWQYELALKTAIGRVQEALVQEKAQAESLTRLRGQIELGGRVLAEARRLFEQGQSDYLPVLTALSSLASLERDGLRAQRLLLSYRVQLYRALGGNWSYDVTTASD